MNKTLRKSSPWNSNSSPTERELSTFFQYRTMALRLEVLLLIPAVHTQLQVSQVQVEVMVQWSQQNYIISNKSRWYIKNTKPNILYLLAAPENDEQNWWQKTVLVESSTTGNESDLLLAIKNKLLLHQAPTTMCMIPHMNFDGCEFWPWYVDGHILKYPHIY